MVFNFLVETFALGLKNIHLHKLRSLLTTLGIILGVAAVIVMVAIGEGGKQGAIEQVARLGARNILLRSVPPPEGTDASSRSQRTLDYGLRRLDYRRLQELPGVTHVIPMRDLQQKVTYGERRSGTAIGTVPEAFEVMNLKTERGRVFNELDMTGPDPQDPRPAAVCVLGALAAQQLFPFSDPLGEKIQVGTANAGLLFLEVVGVLEPTGLRPDGEGFTSRDIDQDIYFPLTVAQAAFGDTIIVHKAGSFERKLIELSEIWIQVEPDADVLQIASIADNLVAMNHKVRDYDVKVPLSILRSKEEITRTFNLVIVGVASISLLVGGIGIMNIMLASITERTKEIGIRRALGAKQRHITLQFLIETTVVSLAGGLIGIGLGSAVALGVPVLVRYFRNQNYPTQIAPWSVVVSFAAAAVIGIVFGLYPAMKAARMNPIEALRHE